MKKAYLIIVYILCAYSMQAQNGTGAIKGHILDHETDEHLPGVTIYIEETKQATMTDETGHFSLPDIQQGSYNLVVQYIGYKTVKEKVLVMQGQHKNVSIYIDSEDQMLGEVAITSTARSLNRKMSTVIINQLTPQTLEATNSTSLAQGLNYVPGLRVENNCQNCGTQEVRINGLKGQYSQLLIDGQPIFTSLSSLYGLEQIPTNMIGEVEVIRGGGSVLHGANAIGGVVNIVTKEPIKNSYEAKYNLSLIDGKSADNLASINTSFVDKAKMSGISVFANMRNRNPWDANGDGFSEIGKNRASSIGFRSYLKPEPNDKLTLEYHYISEYRRGGDNISRPPHEAELAETTNYRIHSGSASYLHATKDNKRKLSVTTALQQTARDAYFGEGMDLKGYSNTSELSFNGRLNYEVNMDKFLFMPAKLSVGYTHEYRNLEDSIYSRDIKQVINVGSIYAQNEWRNDNLTLVAGIRADKHSKLSTINIIPRASARYRIAKDMNLRASYAMGYQAPEIIGADLDVPIISGSPTLTVLDENAKREYSHTVNGGIDFSVYSDAIYSYFLIEGFYTKINRVLVDEETGEDHLGNTIITRSNGDGAYIAGINIEANVQPITWLDIQAGMTIQRSRYTEAINWSDEDYVEPVKNMLRSPNVYGFFSATATPHKSYAFSVSGTYTGSMYAAHFGGAPGVPLDVTEKTRSFLTITPKISYFVNLNNSTKIEFSGGVQNIFNQIQKDYDRGSSRDSEYIYGPSLPRTYFVGMKIFSI